MKPCTNCVDLVNGCSPITTDEVIYSGPNLPCSTANTKDTLTLVLQKIDAKLCAGGGAGVNLAYIASPFNGEITNNAGTGVIIPLADSINAGLLSPGDFDIIQNIDDSVVHKAGIETITGQKTVAPLVNTTGFIIDMPMVNNFPTLGVPDALVIRTRGHNGPTASYVDGVNILPEGNRNLGFSFNNINTPVDVTNSVGIDIRFKSTSTNNIVMQAMKGSGNIVYSVNDNGDLLATTLAKIGGLSTQYLMADGSVSTLSNPITGLGTVNTVPKFGTATSLVNSSITDSGTGAGGIVNINNFIGGTVTRVLPSGNTSIGQTYNLTQTDPTSRLVTKLNANYSEDGVASTANSSGLLDISVNINKTTNQPASNYTGSQILVNQNGSGTIGNIVGSSIGFIGTGTGNVSNLTGLSINTTLSNTYGITSYFGINILSNPQNNITGAKGIVIADLFGTSSARGIELNISDGSGKHNFYARGTAPNYFAGNTLIGTTADSGAKLTVGGSINASSAIARGQYINPALVATANNDILVGLDINPTYNNGSFTNVLGLSMRHNADIQPSINSSINLGSTSFRYNAIHGVSLTLTNISPVLTSGLNFTDTTRAISLTRMFGTTGNWVFQNGGTFTDNGYRLDVQGTTRLGNTTTIQIVPTTSAGTFDILTRNTTTGVVEKITSTSVIGGSGTLNTIPKFTPNGTTLGNSSITDSGTGVGGKVNINNFIGGAVTRVIPAGTTQSGQVIHLTGTDPTSQLNNSLDVWYDEDGIATGFINPLTYNTLNINKTTNQPTADYTSLFGFIRQANNGTVNNITAFRAALGGTGTGAVLGYAALIEGNQFAFSNTYSINNFYALRFLSNPLNNVTNAYGLAIGNLFGSTISRAVDTNVSAGTGKYNGYFQGTAPNYFNGNTLIGTTTDSLAKLTVGGSVNASAGLARGTYVNPTLVATANNDLLVGLEINPIINTGAFTGVNNNALRVVGFSQFNGGVRVLSNLDIYGGNSYINSGGDFDTSTTRTNAVVKSSRLIMPHYLLAEEQAMLIYGTSDATSNILRLGGGSSIANTSTQIDFYTASNNTTIIGTVQGRLFGTGNWVLQNGGALTDNGYRFDVQGTTRLAQTVTLGTQPTTSVGTYDILTRNTATGIVEKLVSTTFELIANKQNSMVIDGSGVKYPTVDAVNLQTNNIARAIVATGFLDTTDTFAISRFDDFTLHINASQFGIAFSQRFKTPPFAPSDGIINIAAQNVPLSAIGLAVDGTYIKFVGIQFNGTILWSDTQFIQSPSVCQLGIVLVKRVAGVTSFIDINRTAITIPDIAAYSNLDTSVGVKATTSISAIPGTLSHSNAQGSLVGISVAWGTTNNDKKIIPLLNPTTFTRLHPGNALTVVPPATFTVMDPGNYYNGAALVAVPGGANVSTVQRLLFTVNGNFVWQYGQATYANLVAAQNNIQQAVFTNILPEGTFAEVGRMAITKNCSDLASSNAQYYPTGGSGGGGSFPILPTAWGAITGSIDDQLDLKARLDAAARPYKVYTALLTQTGVSAPVANVLENSLGGAIVWSYFAVGIYIGTLAGAFTPNKTHRSISRDSIPFVAAIGENGVNEVQINTANSSGTLVDGVLTRTSIEIRVYP